MGLIVIMSILGFVLGGWQSYVAGHDIDWMVISAYFGQFVWFAWACVINAITYDPDLADENY